MLLIKIDGKRFNSSITGYHYIHTLSDFVLKSDRYAIEKSLDGMLGEWEPVECDFKPWKESGTCVLGGNTVDEIQLLVDDHIIKTQTMKGSSYAKPFEERILAWEQFLKDVQDILDVWVKVQGVWLYLEAIFASEDIMKQMPTEGRLFREVDVVWRRIMLDATDARQALKVFKTEGMLAGFRECHEKLETVQKGLNDYLETKRLYFARFFFLSNDNLLEILSETKDPNRVTPHLKKAFEGVQNLQITSELVVDAMISGEKEEVPLCEAIHTADARGLVEVADVRLWSPYGSLWVRVVRRHSDRWSHREEGPYTHQHVSNTRSGKVSRLEWRVADIEVARTRAPQCPPLRSGWGNSSRSWRRPSARRSSRPTRTTARSNTISGCRAGRDRWCSPRGTCIGRRRSWTTLSARATPACRRTARR